MPSGGAESFLAFLLGGGVDLVRGDPGLVSWEQQGSSSSGSFQIFVKNTPGVPWLWDLIHTSMLTCGICFQDSRASVCSNIFICKKAVQSQQNNALPPLPFMATSIAGLPGKSHTIIFMSYSAEPSI